MSNDGSSRGARSRPGLSRNTGGFSTRDFNVIDQSVNLMGMSGDSRGVGGVGVDPDDDEQRRNAGGGGGGISGLWRSNARNNERRPRPPPPQIFSNPWDHEYGDADVATADAEEYIEGKDRKHFGPSCRGIGLKSVMTIVMGLTAFLLIFTSFRSFESLQRQQRDKAVPPPNPITNANKTNVGTKHDGYVATNKGANNNLVFLENGQPYTAKRADGIRKAILDSGVTPKDVLDDDDGSPQRSALRWLIYEDPGFLQADDDGLLDRYGLAVLFFATNPHHADDDGLVSWKDTGGWMSETGICSWAGIECVPIEQEPSKQNDYQPFTKTYDANANVVSIHQAGNNLRGTLPDELGSAFSALETIDLEGNGIGGTLPSALKEQDRNLRYLVLSRNEFTGTIPPEYVTFRDLHQLGLAHNDLTGPVWRDEWSTSFTKLRHFDVSHNDLTGTIPDFSNMSRMNGLYLGSNKLKGSIPTSMAGMSSLMKLELNDNQLTGSIDPLEKLENLEVIRISGNNQLKGTIPDFFDHLFRLHEFDAARCGFTGTIPHTLTHLQSIRTLDLGKNALRGSIPPGFGLMTDVVTVTLSDNELEGTIPTLLGRLDDVKTLALGNNKLTGTIPTELGGCFRLRSLHLNSNGLVGSIPSQLGDLTVLSSLRLESNALEDSTTMPPQVCALRDDNDLSVLVADCEVSCDCCTECQ